MPTQVITIKPDGSLCGLDHKKKGLNLRQFGKAEIKRVTLIEWDEEKQYWFIRWADHIEGGIAWSLEFVKDWLNDLLKDNLGFSSVGLAADGWHKIYFEDYEEAVACEVAVIQAMQLKGEGQEIFG